MRRWALSHRAAVRIGAILAIAAAVVLPISIREVLVRRHLAAVSTWLRATEADWRFAQLTDARLGNVSLFTWYLDNGVVGARPVDPQRAFDAETRAAVAAFARAHDAPRPVRFLTPSR